MKDSSVTNNSSGFYPDSNTLNTNTTAKTNTTTPSNNTFYDGRRITQSKSSLLSESEDSASFAPSMPSMSSASTPKLNTVSTNLASTIDSTRTVNSAGLVDGGISSGSAPTSSEIKYVKFKNYGLHKSLGENLNTIESVISGSGSTTASSVKNHKNQNLHTDSSGVNSYISKSTMNLNTNASSFFESGFYDLNNTMYSNMYAKKNKNGKTAEQEAIYNRENRYSLCKNYKNEFNSNKQLNGTGASSSRDNSRGRNCYTPSVPLNSRSMFKSCSPQRSNKRSSQLDYKYANPVVICRAQTNFARFEPRPVVEKPSAQINLQNSEGLFLFEKIKLHQNLH
jgi:hypothetical protein